MWEHFHHQADIGVRGVGASLEEAFEQGALALMGVICSLETVAAKEQIEINCRGDNVELLFVDWLNALIYEMATRQMLFSRFEVKIDGDKLSAKAWGEKAYAEKHETAVEVKGATYTQLEVARKNGKWTAQCVVDV